MCRNILHISCGKLNTKQLYFRNSKNSWLFINITTVSSHDNYTFRSAIGCSILFGTGLQKRGLCGLLKIDGEICSVYNAGVNFCHQGTRKCKCTASFRKCLKYSKLEIPTLAHFYFLCAFVASCRSFLVRDSIVIISLRNPI